MAQALQVIAVGEPAPVALVVHDVVHIGGQCTNATPGTLSAERLPQKLRRAEIIHPFWRPVHPAPGLRLFAALAVLGLMCWAVAVTGQRTASWMPTRPERLQGHGLSPPGKTKSA